MQWTNGFHFAIVVFMGGFLQVLAAVVVNPGPAAHDIFWGHDVMGIPESNGQLFDLMRHIHRLMYVGASSNLCLYNWNFRTPERRRLSRTQADLGRPISDDLALGLGTKSSSSD